MAIQKQTSQSEIRIHNLLLQWLTSHPPKDEQEADTRTKRRLRHKPALLGIEGQGDVI